MIRVTTRWIRKSWTIFYWAWQMPFPSTLLQNKVLRSISVLWNAGAGKPVSVAGLPDLWKKWPVLLSGVITTDPGIEAKP